VLPLGNVQYKRHLIPLPGSIEAALEYRYGATWRVPRYMYKGRDTVECGKTYFKVLSFLGHLGIRL
jgi:hypothetical protein